MAKRNNTRMAPPPPPGEQITIRGKVVGANGLPLIMTKVQAFSPILGQLSEAGTAYTDAQGNYSLTVSKDLAWVNLAVGNDDQNPLLKSGLLRPDELKGNYNFAIRSQANQGAATEFAYIGQQLKNQGVNTIKDLQENDERADIAILAQATGLQEAQLALFILAHRHGANTRTQINPELFYGLFRQGYLAEVDTLLNAPNKILEARLKTAQENKIVGQSAWDSNTDDQIINHQMLRTEANAFSSIDEFLRVAFTNQAIRLSIGKHYDQYGNDKAAFWKNLPANINAQQLKVMEELSPMLLRNAALAGRLVSINGSLPNQASDLLKLPNYKLYTETGWQALLSNQSTFPEIIRGANPAEKRQNYARYLTNYVRAIYPMQVLAEKINRGEVVLKNNNTRSEIYDFLHNNTSFDLATSKVNDLKIDLSPDAVLELQRLQTLNRLAKDEAMLTTLQQHGADDALQIVRTRGRDLEALNPTDQKLLLARADDHVAAQALSIALHGRDTNSEPVAGLQRFTGGKSQDYCEVKDCESLHGAAAYFVDLLDFMGGDQDAGTEKAKPFESFSQRRPDLLELELTCANTDTPMPYIDVVNEILEYKVAHSHLSSEAVQNTPININRGEKEKLLTEPEHVNTAAYDRLKAAQAVYPLHLPFNYAWEAARAYLGKAGVSYYDLLSKTRTNQSWSIDWPEELWLEYLGVSLEEWQHVFMPLQFESTRLEAYFAGLEVPQRENVNTFLELFQLRFDELEAILKGDYFAKNANPIALFFTSGGNDLCQAVYYKIAYRNGDPLSHLDWSRLYYFMRVWKKLGWSIEETNTWLSLLLPSTARTFGPALHDLAWVKRVADYYKISDERGMEVLLDLVQGGNAENVFARLLNISAKELRDYLALIAPDDYETFLSAPGFPQIWYYSQCIQAIKSSGFDAAELAYLYRHTYASDSAWAESEKAILKKMEDLNTGLSAVEKSIDLSGATSNLELIRVNFGPYFEGDTLSKFLTALANPEATLERDLAETIIAAFVPAVPLPDYVDKFINHPRSDQAQWLVDIIFPNIIAEKRKAFIAETLSTQLGLQGNVAKALLNDPNLLQSVTDSSQAIIADFNLRIADFPNVSPETVNLFQKAYVRLRKAAVLCNKFKIFEDELPYLAGAERDGFNGLPTERLDGSTLGGLTFANHWLPWFRYAQLREKWTKGKRSLMFILQAWDASQGLLNAREWFQVESEVWESMIELMDFTGTSFDTDNVLDMALLSQFERLHELLLLNKGYGLNIAKIGAWTTDRSRLELAVLDDIKAWFKKRFDGKSSQNNAVKELEDLLRKRRRDALVAYLIQQDTAIKTPNDLYTQLLIDVEMESCMKTSRLKLAISSAQLFLQRCLLGLETGIPSSTLDGKRWKWMKNFRVWEANRKIFLYPENWLDPEFRHNQTELFKEAESQLMQGDMSDEQVKQVFADYIHNFEPIAKLQPKALFTEKTLDNTVVHVIGRTFAQPSKHYYRKWDSSHNAWSAWTKIPIEMDGEHLMPVVWQDSLYIFWVTFMEKGENDFVNTEENGAQKTVKKLDISISYTEYRGGKWLPRKTLRQLDKKDCYIESSVKLEEVFTKIIPSDTALEIIIGLKHDKLSNGYYQYNSISIRIEERNQDVLFDSGTPKISGTLLFNDPDKLSYNNEIIGSTSIAIDSRGPEFYHFIGEKHLMYNTKEHVYFAALRTETLPPIWITPLEPGLTEQLPNILEGGFTDSMTWLTNPLIDTNFGGLAKTIQLSRGTLIAKF